MSAIAEDVFIHLSRGFTREIELRRPHFTSNDRKHMVATNIYHKIDGLYEQKFREQRKSMQSFSGTTEMKGCVCVLGPQSLFSDKVNCQCKTSCLLDKKTSLCVRSFLLNRPEIMNPSELPARL